jgi:quinone-modifying oxidoreductase subunit QmoA
MADIQTTQSAGLDILVLGGGVAGISAAIEAAEAGCNVTLIEKTPFLGGRAIRSHLYFPKLCPPTCGLEINFQRIKKNPRIRVLTQAELERLDGAPGDFQATVKIAPRYVNANCTLCGACTQACPAERTDEVNYGLSRTRAAYLPSLMAFPSRYVIDRQACAEGCHACVDACQYAAIDLDQKPVEKALHVAAVIAATGWTSYDATKITNLGFGRCRNVVTNVILERLASLSGPTQGKILRPSDNQPPRTVAFVQCAGSRDANHLPYCSAVCCSASLKQATYLRSQWPECEITIFYIDLRTPGLLQDFRDKVMADGSIRLVKGKVGKIEEDAATGDRVVTAEDALTGKKTSTRFDMVVLATGIVPNTQGLPAGFCLDEFGFVTNESKGLYGAGCASRPHEVAASIRDATGTALRALQCVVEGLPRGQ